MRVASGDTARGGIGMSVCAAEVPQFDHAQSIFGPGPDAPGDLRDRRRIEPVDEAAPVCDALRRDGIAMDVRQLTRSYDRRVVVDLRAAAEHRREDPATGGLQVGHARIDVRDAQMRDKASAEHIR